MAAMYREPPAPAAALVPLLPDGRVLVGERSLDARSLPGYLAFPGGAAEHIDERLPLADPREEERLERACALRELGEETGHWLVCDEDRSPPPRAKRQSFVDHLEQGVPLDEALRRARLLLDDRALVPLGRWRMRRFDLRQYLLPLKHPPDVRTREGPELERVRFEPIADVRAAWRLGDALLIPPIRFVVTHLAEAVARHAPLEEIVVALRDVPEPPVLSDIVEGIAVEPFRTPTLPPAITTNTVLLGAGDYWIVDPATPFPDERERFDALLDHLEAQGRRPLGIVLTHHHRDHVGDVARLQQKRGLKVLAHEETARRVDFAVDRLLVEGDELDCRGDPARRFSVLFTPGHAPGHLCLLEEETGVLVAGDMVAAEGSILIDPSEGHMGTYLESLERLARLPVRRVVPAHGPLIARGREKLEEQIAHRRLRQEQVYEALPEEGPGVSPEDLVPGIYGETTSRALYPLAARSVLSALALLVEEGRAVEDLGRYRRL